MPHDASYASMCLLAAAMHTHGLPCVRTTAFLPLLQSPAARACMFCLFLGQYIKPFNKSIYAGLWRDLPVGDTRRTAAAGINKPVAIGKYHDKLDKKEWEAKRAKGLPVPDN
jgi:hypothetical protein